MVGFRIAPVHCNACRWLKVPHSRGTEEGPSVAGFLRNHADGIVAMDLSVVPTISFRLLYGLLIMGHGRRQILWVGAGLVALEVSHRRSP